MNKVVLLSEIKKENKDLKSDIKVNNEELKNKYLDFENNIFNNKLNTKINENELSLELKRSFCINKNIFLSFINSIYNDYLGTSSIVEFYKEENESNCFLNNPNCIFNARVEDEYRTYKYKIEIQAEDYENIAIMIYKKEITHKNNNIVNFNMKKDQYQSLIEKKEKGNFSDLCLIMLNSNIDVPDNYKIKENYRACSSDIKIIKLWKYDFKKIIDEEMYLFLCAKVLDLMNIIKSMKNIVNSKCTIDFEIQRFFNSMNRYFEVLKSKEIINDNDIESLNSISKNILEIIY